LKNLKIELFKILVKFNFENMFFESLKNVIQVANERAIRNFGGEGERGCLSFFKLFLICFIKRLNFI
jgi:hypothetical protein